VLAGGGVGEDLVAPVGGQVIDLAVVVLAAGGHPRVPDLRHHAAPARRARGVCGRPDWSFPRQCPAAMTGGVAAMTPDCSVNGQACLVRRRSFPDIVSRRRDLAWVVRRRAGRPCRVTVVSPTRDDRQPGQDHRCNDFMDLPEPGLPPKSVPLFSMGRAQSTSPSDGVNASASSRPDTTRETADTRSDQPTSP